MLALYIALRIGLDRPFWSLLTAYIVANPLSGAVRSKAIYRVGGTILGSLAAVLLVPWLSNAPELLSLALAVWVAVCLYVSLLDRTPRSYVFMLAGYTAALIGFPSVTDPASVFDVGLARLEEITLGITCATLVHSLVFPQSLGPVLLARLDRAIHDAQQWMVDAFGGDTVVRGLRDHRKLAEDITELRLLSTHLPFDTSHLRWTSSAIRMLHDRLSALVPLISAVEDRLRTLRSTGEAELSPRWRGLLSDITHWVEVPPTMSSGNESAERLRREIAAVTPDIGADASWVTVLKVDLCERMLALIDAWEQCKTLRRQADAGFTGGARSTMDGSAGLSARVLHKDRGLALRSSFAAFIAIGACCAFWIGTAWSGGAVAAMMAAVFCCFFATQDDPAQGIRLFLKYTILSIPASALYVLAILPAVHNFETLMLVMAPMFLLLGVYFARPATSLQAMAFILGVAGTFSLQDTGTADLLSFTNGMLAQLAGIGAAVLFTRLLRSVNADWTARRLLRAGWSELAALGAAVRAPSIAAMSARMLDRVGLLKPRLAMAGAQHGLSAIDALGDLRVGLNMTRLLAIQPPGQPQGLVLRPLMLALSQHFRNRPDQSAKAEPALLARLDDTLRDACVLSQRAAVAALVGIRRDLFPDALPYRSSTDSKELAR
jgi:uncharacterized membrane protein YccC